MLKVAPCAGIYFVKNIIYYSWVEVYQNTFPVITIIFIAGFAEKLFKELEGSKERFEVKMMMMDLISRLIGIHEVSF